MFIFHNFKLNFPRFDSPKIGDDLENCILTSSPPTSLENGHGVRPNSGHELYARGNYGRGCEPALYDDVQHRDEGKFYLFISHKAIFTFKYHIKLSIYFKHLLFVEVGVIKNSLTRKKFDVRIWKREFWK